MTERETVTRLLMRAAAVGCAALVLGPGPEHDQTMATTRGTTGCSPSG